MSASLPPLNFLASSSAYTDYRPAIGPSGDVVIFERTPVGGGLTTLCSIADLTAPDPVPFLSGTPLPPSQTRPDFCWSTGSIAFNGAETNQSAVRVWQVGADGAGPHPIANTQRSAYPTWSLDGTLIVTENAGPAAAPRPCNTVFDTNGTAPPPYPNIDGTDQAGTPLFGGMPTVGPRDLPQIAFAGQPVLVGWGGATSPQPAYNQDKNYIFLNAVTNGVFTSIPMESAASVTTYEASHQGRAPAWSPDGTTIAFESNRFGSGYAIYLCDLATGAIVQATDPSLGGQHAKFFPGGTRLILCIRHPGGSPATMGIAWVDISALLKS
jgi:Tol biopolymer transport system component